jgi:mono/diheme cytochrome c family protein
MNRIASTGVALLAAGLVAFSLAAKKPRSRAEAAAGEGPVARLSEAPASAKSLRNPFTGDARAVAAGRKLFLRHCAECHGRDAEGRGRAPDLRLPGIQNAPPGALFWAIRNGRLRKGMPSWSELPDAQRWQLVTYLQSLK